MEYYVLMYGDKFIDVDRLGNGLFVTNKPTLMSVDLTPDKLLDEWTEKIIMDGCNRIFMNRFIDNWNKLKLKKIKITFI